MMRPKTPPLFAVALVIVAATVGVGVARPAEPLQRPGSENCRTSDQELGLPPGEHTIPFSMSYHASGAPGIGHFDMDVTYEGSVEVTVSEQRRVVSATADVDVSFDGAVTGVPEIAGDLTGGGSGALRLSEANDERIRLIGTIEGSGELGFSGMASSSFSSADSTDETLTLAIELGEGSCGGAGGSVDSAFVTSAVTGAQGSGMAVEQSPSNWSVGADLSPEAEAIIAELAKIDPSATSGPARKSTTNRLRKLGQRIEDLAAEERDCLFRIWSNTARRVMEKRIDADMAVVQSIQPTSADMGPLHGAVGTLLESTQQYYVLGLDTCSEQKPVFDTITATLERFLRRAIAEDRILDMMRLTRDYSMLGQVARELAAEVDARFSDEISTWGEATRAALTQRASAARAEGTSGCSAVDRQTVRNAIAAQSSMELYGLAPPPPPLQDVLDLAATLGC